MKTDQGQQKRRIQTLQYLNSVLSDMFQNGFNLSPMVVQSISKKKVVNIQDVQQLAELTVTQKDRSLYKQAKGQYQPFLYEQISLEKFKSLNSSTIASQRQDNISSSSYDKKLQTVTRGVKIVVKVKRK